MASASRKNKIVKKAAPKKRPKVDPKYLEKFTMSGTFEEIIKDLVTPTKKIEQK